MPSLLENAANRDLLTAWRNGSQQAAQILVRRYMARLCALARSRLSERLARRMDADDVVMSAWRSFFTAVDGSQIHAPHNDDLWPLLVTLTLRKLSRQTARHFADRRTVNAESSALTEHWQEVVAREPTPAEAAVVTDELEQLMSGLSSADRQILERRLQGEDQAEIARALDRSERTVRRALQRIRKQFLHTQQNHAEVADFAEHTVPATTVRHNVPAVNTSVPTVSFDDLVLERMVGHGAFGKVYRSRYRPDDSTVAVKFLRRHLWSNRRAVAQLVREFSIVSQLDHPGIARVHGWGRMAHGSTFVVMDWIDGASLVDHLPWFQTSPQRVVECGMALCSAIEAAHQAGIIHGDLTPGNVLRSTDGKYVLTDFGFSQVTGHASSATIGGTPGYLAPEQISAAFGSIGPPTDVLGLGGILYFLVTGQAPIAGRDIPDTLARTLSNVAITSVRSLAPQVPETLCNLIDSCLHKERTERPADIDEVRRRLQQVDDALSG